MSRSYRVIRSLAVGLDLKVTSVVVGKSSHRALQVTGSSLDEMDDRCTDGGGRLASILTEGENTLAQAAQRCLLGGGVDHRYAQARQTGFRRSPTDDEVTGSCHPYAGEVDNALFRRRAKVVAATCRARGLLSVRAARLVVTWHDHVSGPRRDPRHWPAQLVVWHAHLWSADQRLRASSATSLAGRIGARAASGQSAAWCQRKGIALARCSGGSEPRQSRVGRFVMFTERAGGSMHAR